METTILMHLESREHLIAMPMGLVGADVIQKFWQNTDFGKIHKCHCVNITRIPQHA